MAFTSLSLYSGFGFSAVHLGSDAIAMLMWEAILCFGKQAPIVLTMRAPQSPYTDRKLVQLNSQGIQSRSLWLILWGLIHVCL